MANKICPECNGDFLVDGGDLEFYKKMAVKIADKEFLIPEPTLCPTCRSQRRLAYRNDRSLYKSKSDLSGVDLITMYNPEYGYTIYEYKEWWSDKWNPFDYGQDFDSNKSFFDQFKELQDLNGKVDHKPDGGKDVSDSIVLCTDALLETAGKPTSRYFF